MLLELALQYIDAVIYSLLEAICSLVYEEVRAVDLELDGCFLVVRDFGLDNL